MYVYIYVYMYIYIYINIYIYLCISGSVVVGSNVTQGTLLLT